MHKTARVGLLLVLLLLSACQPASNATTLPTPTMVALPTMVETAEPVPTLAAETGIAAKQATPSATSATAEVAVPTSAEAMSPTATPAPANPASRVMVIGVRSALTLRARPQPDAAVVTTLPGAQVTWAEGRSADGQWLWVAYDDAGDRAWVGRGEVKAWGELGDLPVIAPEAAAATRQAAQPAAAAVQGGLTGRVTASAVNVRRGPGLDQAVIGQVAAGDEVTVVGRSGVGDWLAIAWEGGTAWIAAPLVAISGTISALPVLATQTSGLPTQSAGEGTAAGGKIVFETATGGDIYLVNADGSGLRRLTDGIDPVLSPDGTRVAYARWGAPPGVFILDLRTGQEQRVASVNRPRGPTWSPDGTRLAFTHVTRTRTCVDLGFACVDIEEVRRMLGGQDCIDTPQGRRCIGDFPLVKVDDNGLAEANPADGTRENLISEGTIQSLEWHPRRDLFLFRGKQGLQALEPGQAQVPLGNNPDISSAVWSPDGQQIAAQMRFPDRTEIVLLDAAGNVVRYLTQPPPTYEHPGQPPPHNVAPAWSPDGRSLLFLSNRDGAWRPYIINADGTDPRLWLPDIIGHLSFRYDFAAERMLSWGK